MKKKKARRKKRSKEKRQQENGKINKKGDDAQKSDDELDVDDTTMESNLVDYFTPHVVVRASGKIRSFDFCLKELKGGAIQVCVVHNSFHFLCHFISFL